MSIRTELQSAREELARYCQRLAADGLAVGAAGNLSVRVGSRVVITPSGLDYGELTAGEMCVVSLSGDELDAPEAPSSELPLHLAIYRTTEAAAVVHTHSAEVVALSVTRAELPAVHYAITSMGGPVRVAAYARFGSAGLAAAVLSALDGRRAAILQNHGAVCYGASLADAYDRAVLLEWLARVYRLARCYGAPRILTDAELAEVSAETRRLRYGERRRR